MYQKTIGGETKIPLDIKAPISQPQIPVSPLFQPFVEPNSYLMIKKDEGLRTSLMVGINNSVSGFLYGLQNGKQVYDVNMDDYHPDFKEQVAEQAATLLDPIGILSGAGIYKVGSRLFGTAVNKYIAPRLAKWFLNSQQKYFTNALPKTNMGEKVSQWAREQVVGKVTRYGLELGQSAFSLGNVYGAHGVLSSAANQKTNM